MWCDEISRDPAAGSGPLAMATDTAPTGGREAIAGLLMRERQYEYTQLKSFRSYIDDRIAYISFYSSFFVNVCEQNKLYKQSSVFKFNFELFWRNRE